MINRMILILIDHFSSTLMAMSLGVPLMVYIYIYISTRIRFPRASSHVSDFSSHNKFLTDKLLKQKLLVS